MKVVLFIPVEMEVESWDDAHGIGRTMVAVTEPPLDEDTRVKSWTHDDAYVFEGDIPALRERLGMW